MKVLVLAIVWVVQAALVLVLADAQWIEHESRAEQLRMTTMLGEERYSRVAESATETYRKWFVEAGWVARSYTQLLPDRSQRQHGMEKLAPWFWTWFERRLDAFWWLAYRALFRWQVGAAWCVPIAVVILAACVDGYVRRAVKRADRIGPSSDRHRGAALALLLLIFLAALYFTLPICVDPAVVPGWGLAVAIVSRIWLANLQQYV